MEFGSFQVFHIIVYHLFETIRNNIKNIQYYLHGIVIAYFTAGIFISFDKSPAKHL